jgi:hypothetical protein
LLKSSLSFYNNTKTQRCEMLYYWFFRFACIWTSWKTTVVHSLARKTSSRTHPLMEELYRTLNGMSVNNIEHIPPVFVSVYTHTHVLSLSLSVHLGSFLSCCCCC